MIGLLSLFTWKIKLGLVAAAGLGMWWYIGHVKTVAYELGANDKEISMLENEAQRIEQAAALERAELAVERQDLEAIREVIEGERNALVSQRRTIAVELNRGIQVIAQRETNVRNQTLSVSDADLVPAIRAVLPAIRAAESGRTAP